MGKALIYIVPFALALYAVIDLWRSQPSEYADLTRWGWVAVIVLLPVIGPIAWLLISRARRGGPGTLRSPKAPPRLPGGRAWPSRRPGPLAPDDDPDFLWRLERERRHREQPGADGASRGDDPTSGPVTDGAEDLRPDGSEDHRPDGSEASDSSDGTPGTPSGPA